MSQKIKPNFEVCEKCGKKLIERMPNGLWHFMFGKPIGGETNPPVEMYIQGNLKIKCLRRSCGHWNILNYFPNVLQSDKTENLDCAKE